MAPTVREYGMVVLAVGLPGARGAARLALLVMLAMTCHAGVHAAMLPRIGLVVLAAVQETPEDLAFLEELAKDFRRGGSYSAKRDLDDYLDEYPSSTEARQLAAEVALKRGELDEVERHLGFVSEPAPALLSRVLLRRGRYEDALEMARAGALSAVASARLEVAALDGLGRSREAVRRAREAAAAIDDRELDGHGLVDLAWLYLMQRKFEIANQALVFADAELNGKRGATYQLKEPAVIVALGEVYHATRQSGQGGLDKTLAALNEVLAIDSGHADALTVKAKVYRYGNNGQAAAAALERALTRDPGHPEALVLRGEMMLQSRRLEDAVSLANQVLEENPRHRGALALRAAALAVSRQQKESKAARALFEQRHPESAALEGLLGRVLQEHYRFAESVEPLERALALEPENEDPLAVLGQSLAHLGREEEARAALEEHRERSPFPFPWRENMLEVLGRLDEWAEIKTEDGLRVLLPSGEQQVLGVLLPEVLSEARDDLARRWGFDPQELDEVLIEVFDVHADFSARTVGFEGFFAVGACFGNVVTLVSPLSEMRRRFHWQQTAVHEYAHVVTLGLSKQRLPRWLSEGISVVEERKSNPDWTRPLERDVLDARANNLIFEVTRLDEAFLDGQTVMLGYYLGSLVCEVVERDFGFPKLVEMVVAYGDGSTTREVVQDVLGIEPEELDARILNYIDTEIAGRASVRPRLGVGAKELLRQRAVAGEDEALVELAWAYHFLGQTVDRDNTLRRARKKLGSSPAILRIEADIALRSGQRKQAREKLEALASDDALEADGLVQLGRLLLAEQQREAALDALRKARALFPSDTSDQGALLALYETLDRDDEAEKQEWLEIVRATCRFDETAIEPRRLLAREALDSDDLDTAIALYEEIVAIDPYAPGSRMQLAQVYRDTGREVSARRQWEFVLGMRAYQVPASDAAHGPLGNLLDDDLQKMQERARNFLAENDNSEN
ncbi:MAG: tetratricopeptide repeat protein [Planctomycetota bacterium]|nr:tetratricopeptide repeat protein [Planctomycetota bacterium]